MGHFTPPFDYNLRTYKKIQGVRNENCPEDRNERQQLIFQNKTLKFVGRSE